MRCEAMSLIKRGPARTRTRTRTFVCAKPIRTIIRRSYRARHQKEASSRFFEREYICIQWPRDREARAWAQLESGLELCKMTGVFLRARRHVDVILFFIFFLFYFYSSLSFFSLPPERFVPFHRARVPVASPRPRPPSYEHRIIYGGLQSRSAQW